MAKSIYMRLGTISLLLFWLLPAGNIAWCGEEFAPPPLEAPDNVPASTAVPAAPKSDGKAAPDPIQIAAVKSYLARQSVRPGGDWLTLQDDKGVRWRLKLLTAPEWTVIPIDRERCKVSALFLSSKNARVLVDFHLIFLRKIWNVARVVARPK